MYLGTFLFVNLTVGRLQKVRYAPPTKATTFDLELRMRSLFDLEKTNKHQTHMMILIV